MKLTTFLGASALALVAGSAHAEGKLSIYHWFEYIPAELLEKFEAEYDIDLDFEEGAGHGMYQWDDHDH